MTDPNLTAGRALALRLAAGDDPATVHQLIQDHLSAYDADDARLVLAVALETMTTFIVRPAVAESDDPGAYRAQFRTAADRIAAGPTEEKE
ncbi:MAG TPA: hypothetical protein H9878_16445 [Candidatus Dietzia merdigallinarum]|nr:hypothetical protein [Candidatus Dietzia merdigallinarum]